MQRSQEDFVSLVRNFVAAHPLATLATVNPSGEPEAACVVVVLLDDHTLKLGFSTLEGIYRKYRYLKENPCVAIVFFGHENATVQYEGVATEVGQEGQVRDRLEDETQDDSGQFSRMPEARFFEVAPRWIRYSHFKD